MQHINQGEWWRIVTHPLIHVSAYHFALDAAAFVLLAPLLPYRRLWFCLTACGMGSLALPLLISPAILAHGLCGLSGINHGLMVMAASDRARHSTLSGLLLAGTISKSLVELATGAPILAHPGNIGIPIVESHAGGVLGALGMLLFAIVKK